jgi:hypothetical protein
MSKTSSPPAIHQERHWSIKTRQDFSVALWGTTLPTIFVAMVVWFYRADFYHQQFFTHGASVFTDNVARSAFVFLLAWLVYAPGAGVIALVAPERVRAAMTPVERAVAGFGVGVGLWQVAMLVLGIAGLYYRSVMVGLAFLILVASARHFGKVASAGCRAFATRLAGLRRGVGVAEAFCAGAIVIGLAWLLLVRGLYPGGLGDYFTHYFYYYLEVLKNHSLAPNDVWYHYYYSKGYGLLFLGMLLTDPEAPALVTFCCVAFAAMAIAALIARMAPRSLWPACGALLYLLYNLISISRSLGGEFQKDHETVTALVVLVVWSLCMARRDAARPYVFVAASSAVAAAIITQPIGVILGAYFALLSGWALLRRRWAAMWRHALVGATIGATVLAIFVLNYVETGLATDQSLDLMLRFADMPRLDRWGVIPQLIIIAWGRDNYEAYLPPSGWGSFEFLGYFMRADVLWPMLAAFVFSVGVALVPRMLRRRSRSAATASARDAAAATTIADSVAYLAALLALLVAISLTSGQVQNVSFERFSSFFVPLLVLLAAALCSWMMLRPLGPWQHWLLRSGVPAFLVIATLLLWQHNYDWLNRTYFATANSLRFFDGRYSLAEAYSRQDVGASYGGINPETVAAWRHVEPGSAIWATNVESHCMVPDCWIESVASFKLSSKIVDILDGPPEQAKRLLQEAGINYFLVMKDAELIDVLPYSRLFAPENLGQYLAIKWTNGSAFLLTWIGPDTSPIGRQFLDVYTMLLNRPENKWYRYSALVPQIAHAAARLQSKPWGASPDFPWRQPAAEQPK